MTMPEIERAIEFLLESDARLTAKLDRMTEHQSVVDREIARLAEEAAADRSEIRSAVTTMLSFAESMADNVKLLTQAQQANSQRVARLESRVDSLES